MSFCSEIKDEITNIQIKNDCCKEAYLLGMVSVNGLSETYSTIYEKNLDKENLSNQIESNECCARSYIRGAFLEGGYVNDPENSYHLEIIQHNSQNAEFLVKVFEKFGLKFKILKKKEKIYIYLKDAESISIVINIIGAHKALLNFENIRALHEMRNNINRVVNCETANLSKTLDASVKQVKMITEIAEKVGLNALPKDLQEIAEARLSNPDMSLKELGETLDNKLGKSGVNHRLKKIEEFHEKIFKNENNT